MLKESHITNTLSCFISFFTFEKMLKDLLPGYPL